MELRERVSLLQHAASELLESETNGSIVVGVSGSDCEPLVVTALGCTVLVALGRHSILMTISSLRWDGPSGPRTLAEGCDRTLRTVHDLPAGFVPTISFTDTVNAGRFRKCLG